MRKMKDSGVEWIGEIPEEWEVISQKYIMSKEKKVCNKYTNEDILSLTMNGVIVRDLDNPKGKMPTTFNGYQYVRNGNLLMCLFDIDVTPRCIGLIQNEGLTSPAYSQFVVNNNNVPEYYNYYLHMIDNDKIYLHLSRNLRNSLTETDFGHIKTVKPKPVEQQKIAGYLDKKVGLIDDIIAKTKESIEEYKIYKQALITETVTKGLDPNAKMKDSGIEWIGEIPEGWEVVKIKYIFEIVKRISGELGHDVLSVTQLGLKIKNIKSNEGQLSADYSKYQFVNKGDYVMNHMDLLTGWVDCSNFYGVTSPDYRVFRTNTNSCFKEYFLYIFQTCYTNKIFYGIGSGVAKLGRWRLQTDKFKNFVVPLPSFKMQKKIVHYLKDRIDSIDKHINQKQKLITELETYKKSLIYEVVTGKREIE